MKSPNLLQSRLKNRTIASTLCCASFGILLMGVMAAPARAADIETQAADNSTEQAWTIRIIPLGTPVETAYNEASDDGPVIIPGPSATRAPKLRPHDEQPDNSADAKPARRCAPAKTHAGGPPLDYVAPYEALSPYIHVSPYVPFQIYDFSRGPYSRYQGLFGYRGGYRSMYYLHGQHRQSHRHSHPH